MNNSTAPANSAVGKNSSTPQEANQLF